MHGRDGEAHDKLCCCCFFTWSLLLEEWKEHVCCCPVPRLVVDPSLCSAALFRLQVAAAVVDHISRRVEDVWSVVDAARTSRPGRVPTDRHAGSPADAVHADVRQVEAELIPPAATSASTL
jgi:hypothetical protein